MVYTLGGLRDEFNDILFKKITMVKYSVNITIDVILICVGFSACLNVYLCDGNQSSNMFAVKKSSNKLARGVICCLFNTDS
jgi:small basic protein